MKINKKIINIFKGVYNEYGVEEFLRRLFKVLNINVGKITPKRVIFTDNSIILKAVHPVTIYFEDEYYYVTREYKKYTTYHYYDEQALPFREATTYNTQDGEMIVLDHLDSEEVEFTRILKTSKSDKDFSFGYFEREKMSLNELPIEEKSRYTEFSNNDVDERKVLNIAGTLVYSHHYTDEEENRFMETAACLDKSRYVISGRTRRPNELIKESEKEAIPNIIARGNAFDKENGLEYYYDFSVEKESPKGSVNKPGYISIYYTIYYPATEITHNENINLFAQDVGAFSLNELRFLIFQVNNIPYSFSDYVRDEIIAIREQLLIKRQQKLEDIDAIELQMALHPDYNELAFHIYENIDAYDEVIEAAMHREMSENMQKTLS